MRFALFVSLALTAAAQNVVTGGGYTDPIPLFVAPGQVLTIFVQGVGASLTGPVVAPPGRLPTTLAGINVTVEQGRDYAAPILQVRPVSTCGNCGMLTAITIQIPYEVRPACPPGAICPLESPALVITRLRVSENGAPGSFVVVTPQQDRVHILTGCDNVLPNTSGNPFFPCQPLVTHADGSLVTANAPARPGESLIAYAVGLGATTPAVPTGQPAATAAPTTETFNLNFNYSENAGPTRVAAGQKPLYSGLTPGYAGLYQINFIVPTPATPGFVPGCGPEVQSNFTMTLIGDTSFDGAGICVAVPAP
jgi:uncharacterized protein (TIGR03437 family)